MLPNIFVVCAGHKVARGHFEKTVLKPVLIRDLEPNSNQEEMAVLQKFSANGECRVWGMRNVPRLTTLMSKIHEGDFVLGFYDFHYQTVSRALGRYHSPALSKALWNEELWPHLIFLSDVRKVHVPASSLTPFLCSTYRGPTQIPKDRIAAASQRFGSIDAFLNSRLV